MKLYTSLVILFCCAGTALLAHFFKPALIITSVEQIPDFETIIPQELTDWTAVEQSVNLIVDPTLQAAVDKIYNTTLNRNYINEVGESVMLSIAYGIDQSDSMQVHKPEICYPAQGFVLKNQKYDSFSYAERNIPIKQLDTQRNNRREFVTYWILVGNTIAKSNFNAKLIKLNYGFDGLIPDGLLFRVSSIGKGKDADKHYLLQKQFLRDLLSSLNPQDLNTVIGVK